MKKLISILFLLISLSLLGQDDFTRTLLHADSVNISKTIFDENGNNVTAYGDAQITTNSSKFGNGSLIFDGTGDYFAMPSAAFQLRDQNFSFDFWYKANTIATSEPFFTKYDTTYPNSKSFRFFMTDVSGNTAKLAFYAVNRVDSSPSVAAYYISTSAITIADGSYHHYKLTRSDSTIYMFFDGTLVPLTTTTAISTKTLDDINGDFFIGYRSDISYYLDGNIDEFRISIDTARQTSNFTTETSAYNANTDPEFILTDSLISYYKFDETSGNASDEISSNDLVNRNTVEYSETGILNNAAEFTFADSNNYILEYADQTGLLINDEISFSFWIKLKSQPQSYYPTYSIINQWTNAFSDKSWALAYRTDGFDRLNMAISNEQYDEANNYILENFTLENDSLYHIVISTDAINNLSRFFINDTLRGTVSGSRVTDSIYLSTSNILVGTSIDGGRSDFSIDELAIYHRLLYQDDVDLLWGGGAAIEYPFVLSSSNIKTFNSNPLANISTINGKAINNIKTLNGNSNK